MKNLLIIFITLISFNIIAQQKVHATVYNAVPEQTNNDPGHTAFMFELDLINPFKHKIIAVSRDLLKSYPKGTKVMVKGTSYDGVYVVMDKMNKRYINRIDLLINQEMQIGSWPKATITKIWKLYMTSVDLFNNLTDEDFVAIHDAGQLKSLCQALSLDLQPMNHEEDTTYSAWVVWGLKGPLPSQKQKEILSKRKT